MLRLYCKDDSSSVLVRTAFRNVEPLILMQDPTYRNRWMNCRKNTLIWVTSWRVSRTASLRYVCKTLDICNVVQVVKEFLRSWWSFSGFCSSGSFCTLSSMLKHCVLGLQNFLDSKRKPRFTP